MSVTLAISVVVLFGKYNFCSVLLECIAIKSASYSSLQSVLVPTSTILCALVFNIVRVDIRFMINLHLWFEKTVIPGYGLSIGEY